MTLHFTREIDKLKQMILSLGALVEDTLSRAIEALQKLDVKQAEAIVRNDDLIDQKEVEVEEECLKILALHQPVARDLRYVVATLKINNDLERVGDMAVNIAERAKAMASLGGLPQGISFQTMVNVALEMLHKCLDALVNMDAKLAREVCALDDLIDNLHADTYVLVEKLVKKYPDRTAAIIQLLSISRYLERIGDQATNIAEDVIYMIEGEIVRHDKDKLRLPDNNE